MERLTSDNVFEMSMRELALNQVFIRDGCVWYRRDPEDECSVCDLIRSAAANGLWQDTIELDSDLTDTELGYVMMDWLQFGEAEPEGFLAILYRALWAMAVLRERLREYEDTGLGPEEIMALKSPPNDPLTLTQLREMDGEPVWIEFANCREADGWALVDAARLGVYHACVGFCSFAELFVHWRAFAHKPEDTNA